jgi:hypothetical protein
MVEAGRWKRRILPGCEPEQRREKGDTFALH